MVFKSGGRYLNDRIGSFVFMSLIVSVLTAAAGLPYVILGVLVTGLLASHGLGWVTVEPERLVRMGLTSRKTVITPIVAAVEFKTTHKRTWGRRYILFSYPQLVLTSVKRIRLTPLLSRAPEVTEEQNLIIRNALKVPAEGTVVIPSRNPFTRRSNAKRGPQAVAPEDVPRDPAQVARDETYGTFTPLPGLERHYQGR